MLWRGSVVSLCGAHPLGVAFIRVGGWIKRQNFMTTFYSKFESLFRTPAVRSQQVPVLEIAVMECCPASSPRASPTTPLSTYSTPATGHFLHVPGTWLPCFCLSPLLAVPLVWCWHIFLPFFLQIFAQRSPYQRGIPDHIFQVSIVACQITPKCNFILQHFI